MKRIMSAEGRAWIYNVSIAALLVLAGYGIVENEMVAVWSGLLGAITNGVARANVTDAGAQTNE